MVTALGSIESSCARLRSESQHCTASHCTRTEKLPGSALPCVATLGTLCRHLDPLFIGEIFNSVQVNVIDDK